MTVDLTPRTPPSSKTVLTAWVPRNDKARAERIADALGISLSELVGRSLAAMLPEAEQKLGL